MFNDHIYKELKELKYNQYCSDKIISEIKREITIVKDKYRDILEQLYTNSFKLDLLAQEMSKKFIKIENVPEFENYKLITKTNGKKGKNNAK